MNDGAQAENSPKETIWVQFFLADNNVLVLQKVSVMQQVKGLLMWVSKIELFLNVPLRELLKKLFFPQCSEECFMLQH